MENNAGMMRKKIVMSVNGVCAVWTQLEALTQTHGPNTPIGFASQLIEMLHGLQQSVIDEGFSEWCESAQSCEYVNTVMLSCWW